jgi:hypothetical protein
MRVDRDTLKEPANEGVYVEGLFIEGAKLRAGILDDLKGNEKLLTHSIPLMHISAEMESTTTTNMIAAKQERRAIYYAPVYKNPRRTDVNYICTLKLECPFGEKCGPDVWTLRGVALLCNTK